jgi:hypothetical protein
MDQADQLLHASWLSNSESGEEDLATQVVIEIITEALKTMPRYFPERWSSFAEFQSRRQDWSIRIQSKANGLQVRFPFHGTNFDYISLTPRLPSFHKLHLLRQSKRTTAIKST